MSDLISSPVSRPLTGVYRPPGDKSISHRLAILGAMAQGQSRILGYLDSADTRHTAEAMAQLGAEVAWSKTPQGLCLSIAQRHWVKPQQPLDFGNSGTGMRLVAGLLSGLGDTALGADGPIELVGDASLSRRPMQRIIDPLTAQGARLEATDGHPPLKVWPRRLRGTAHALPIASAQVKSALLLAGIHSEGLTEVIEPATSRDHTERLLGAFGVSVQRSGDHRVSIRGGQTLHGGHHTVPGDLSSAAFILAAASIVPKSIVMIDGVGLNPTRDGVLRIAAKMSARLNLEITHQLGDEPVGQIEVQEASLKGADIDPAWVPLAIDEFPIIMAMAACAEGSTRFSGAQELRVKESDRLALMSQGLSALGIEVHESPDGATVVGGSVRGGEVVCDGDHRIAMSFAILGLVAQSPIVIRDAEWIGTSYPHFVQDLNALGARLEWVS